MFIKRISFLFLAIFITLPLCLYGQWQTTVISEGLNIREEANVESNIIYTLEENAQVILNEELENGWARVTFIEEDESYIGFVNQKYLEIGAMIEPASKEYTKSKIRTSNIVMLVITVLSIVSSIVLPIRKNKIITQETSPMIFPIMSISIYSLVILLFFSKSFWIYYFMQLPDILKLLPIVIAGIFILVGLFSLLRFRKTLDFVKSSKQHYMLFIMLGFTFIYTILFFINLMTVSDANVMEVFSLENSFGRGYILISVINYILLFFTTSFLEIVILRGNRKYITSMLLFSLTLFALSLVMILLIYGVLMLGFMIIKALIVPALIIAVIYLEMRFKIFSTSSASSSSSSSSSPSSGSSYCAGTSFSGSSSGGGYSPSNSSSDDYEEPSITPTPTSNSSSNKPKVYCKYCGKDFNTVKDLTSNWCSSSRHPNGSGHKHVVYEGSEKDKYYCKYCGKEFRTIKDLTSNWCSSSRHPNGSGHRHSVYEGDEKDRYTCKYCGKEFRTIKDLTSNWCSSSRHPNGKGRHEPAK